MEKYRGETIKTFSSTTSLIHCLERPFARPQPSTTAITEPSRDSLEKFEFLCILSAVNNMDKMRMMIDLP